MHRKSIVCPIDWHTVSLKILLVDVPRFELGASSMPRKRASKLRHTPSASATLDAHLREWGRREYNAGTGDRGGGASRNPHRDD